MLIYFIITFSVCVFSSDDVEPIGGDKNNIAVNNLRKQLMQENYDYFINNNETQTAQMRADLKLNKLGSKNKFNETFGFNNTADKKELKSQSKYLITKLDYLSRSNEFDDSQMSYENESDKIHKKPLEHPISAKDLLYYMDEEKLLKDKLGPETREMTARRNMDNITSDKKYKFLKMRHQYRRNGPRRFIQEEGTEGVVIISLDNGTFPEFRLPRARRQYMHDHGEVVAEEEELPPLPINS